MEALVKGTMLHALITSLYSRSRQVMNSTAGVRRSVYSTNQMTQRGTLPIIEKGPLRIADMKVWTVNIDDSFFPAFPALDP